MSGKACRSSTYQGYFAEFGGAYGVAGAGFDVGLTDTGGAIPLPNGFSGVNEAGVAPSLGGMFNASLCYYIPLQ